MSQITIPELPTKPPTSELLLEQESILAEETALPPPITLNSCLFTLLAVILIAASGFISRDIPNPLQLLFSEQGFPETITYSAQIPIVLFSAALLGPALGISATLIFLILGFFALPLFSNGGGLNYLSQPGSGYLLGLIPGTLAASLMTKVILKGIPKKSLWFAIRILATAFLSVTLVHTVGTLGLLMQLFQQTGTGTTVWPESLQWWLYLTLFPIGYDLLVTSVLFLMVRLIRMTAWLALY